MSNRVSVSNLVSVSNRVGDSVCSVRLGLSLISVKHRQAWLSNMALAVKYPNCIKWKGTAVY